MRNFVLLLGLIELFGCNRRPGLQMHSKDSESQSGAAEVAGTSDAGRPGLGRGTEKGDSCNADGPPLVIYDKQSSQFRFCDGGNWVLISREEAEKLSSTHDAAGHSESPGNASATERLPQSAEKAVAHDKNSELAKNKGSSDGTDMVEAQGKVHSTTYFCRRSPTGKVRSYYCQLDGLGDAEAH
jgi:hypothetical protein